MDQEKVEASRAWESGPHLHAHLLLGANRALLSRDLDQAAGAFGPPFIDEALDEGLVGTRDHLVDREFKAADIVMRGQITQIRRAINVVDLDLVLLASLEMILYIKACHPGRVQVVLDVFGHSNALPLIPHLSVEDKNAVSSGEGVHIG